MKFTFDWEQVVRGEIEIDAENGQKAEAIFQQMSLSQKIDKSVLANSNDSSKIQFVEDRRRAISMALDEAKEGDCVLIAGKGHEGFQEVHYTAIPFDDRKVATELLQIKAFGE